MISLILLIFAFVCFVLASLGVKGKIDLVAAGLAFYIGYLLINR